MLVDERIRATHKERKSIRNYIVNLSDISKNVGVSSLCEFSISFFISFFQFIKKTCCSGEYVDHNTFVAFA